MGVMPNGIGDILTGDFLGLPGDLGQVASFFGGGGGLGLIGEQLGLFDEGGLLGDPSLAGGRAADAQVAGRNEAIETIRQQLGPFAQAGQDILPALQQGATVQGFGQNLSDIFSGGFLQPLIDQRTQAVQNQLSAGGLTRSGAGLQAAAAVPQDLALQIEGLLGGRQSNLAQLGLRGAEGLASGVSGQQIGIGQDIGSGILADAQAKAGQQENLFNIGTTVASFFSDPALKENVEPIGKIGGLTVHRWDWIPKAAETVIGTFPKIGFMADEVLKKFPDFVSEFAGFMVIDYHGLLNKLEFADANAC